MFEGNMEVKEPIKLFTHAEVEEARHQGYQTAELQYSRIVKELKEEIKRLKDAE